VTFSNGSSSDCQSYGTYLSVEIMNSSGGSIAAVQGSDTLDVEDIGSGKYLVDINPANGPATIVAQ
jgi:hypothetical protein